jgi:hypothetical protein
MAAVSRPGACAADRKGKRHAIDPEHAMAAHGAWLERPNGRMIGPTAGCRAT